MLALQGKKILLGITGSIAAYKTTLLVRLLVKEGATVQVIFSESAHDFVTPLTLATLSGRPVLTHFVADANGTWNNHVEWGLWADIFLIAPATANTLAHCAQGFCNNLLQAIYLSARCPVWFAPAMDLDMYQHPATKANLQQLQSFGNHIIEARTGQLASGLNGQGRMAEPEELLEILKNALNNNQQPLAGKKVLISAGPTYEPLDPVRFIGNHSSGKMGYALANTASKLGAEVTLVSGPSALEKPHVAHFISVGSAAEMYTAVMKHTDYDIAIMAAAVADYTPLNIATEKIKKQDATFELLLTKTTDIASELGKLKTGTQILVGFALETEAEEVHARQKLAKKNLDIIVLNSLNDPGAGFKTDTNKITIFDRYNRIFKSTLAPKNRIAHDIWDFIIKFEPDETA
jgi:phosphopantothenoylcysteine decarboxylase / phosphopantothenate---cysteine ligase